MLHFMEEQAAEALARAIGSRVKRERKGRDWTLDQLAAAAEVSRRMLVNVEQGSVNPSVGTLLRISDALGIGLPSLVEVPTPLAARLTRAGEGAVLWAGAGGGQGVLVAGTEPPDVVELWDWTLMAGEYHRSEPHSAGTRELLQVQEGTVDIAVGDEVFTLRSGDALTFRGDVAHAYRNETAESARFVLTVFEPGVGASHRSETGNA